MFEETQNTSERQTMSRVETAKFLGVCVGTLKKLDIPCAKVGRRLVYFRDSVNKWLYSQEEERKGKKRKQKPEADADAENNAENPKPEADDAESEADDAESEEKENSDDRNPKVDFEIEKPFDFEEALDSVCAVYAIANTVRAASLANETEFSLDDINALSWVILEELRPLKEELERRL